MRQYYENPVLNYDIRRTIGAARANPRIKREERYELYETEMK